ncbi:DUF1850 domain-containing protein [Roseibaca sp. Y0-43]|uniref:DUF1850 domain-containing protein n=1 Tax=Roseibaca sp. Y0-43 TaxID=2816854 RepID=UPI001D0C40D3|nr:DUF1850 domain-containing protein [Roseibaca sp. Y0-43]MCC1482597.1 DUF1850 domain-containing protein [Roseibaca sp. Y0-43]
MVAALFLWLAAPAWADPMLQVVDPAGKVLAELPFPPEGEICLSWAHSVTGGAVADCFGTTSGRLVLRRSYLHDYAAGLGEVAGRGRVLPAEGGGYWIVEINEPLPPTGLPLRVGPAFVGHSLTNGRDTIDLSALAANQRVSLRATD